LMKLNKLPFLITTFLLIISCSGGGGGGSSAPAVTLTSISVTPLTESISLGETQQFTATGTYSDSSTKNITTSVTWGSSNTAVAAISTTGLATSVAAGTTTITANLSGITSNTAQLIIVTLTSIAITPPNPVIDFGATQQFAATGTYSDSATKDITSSVTWSSDNTSVAAISNKSGSNGLAVSLASGTSTITASLSGITSNAAQLTVNTTPVNNVLAVTVNGSLCSAGSYRNKPCVSVTVCEPGTSNCKTINDILLDTGASGLRIFKSLLTDLTLTPVTSGLGSLADCIKYADYSANWGPVQIADVFLGSEKASNVPIQIIDASFYTVPLSCTENGNYTPDTDPVEAGYNGILGVGLFAEDCGSACTSVASNGMYYSCSGSTCTATTTPLSYQVQNPVSLLPSDNNGVILRLPAVPLGGAASADGVLILGIGTRPNNTSFGLTTYHADSSSGDFITVFNGRSYSTSFIDSGSNGLFFNKSSVSALITCDSGIASGWYCPSSTLSLSATIEDYTGSPSGTVSFQIGDADTLLRSSNKVFIELGGSNTSFDWGLPFFLGKNVYIGIEGKTSGLGTGPYWAY
jgi:hypothetical protein